MKTASQTFTKQELVEMIINSQPLRMEDVDADMRKEMTLSDHQDFSINFKKVVGLDLKYIGANNFIILYEDEFNYKSW